MKYALLLLLLAGNAQAALSGRVVDENGSGIAGATISAAGKTVSADRAGRFVLPSATGPTLLAIAATGYYPVVQTIAALRRRSPEGLFYTAGLDDAAYLQRVAFETVREYERRERSSEGVDKRSTQPER